MVECSTYQYHYGRALALRIEPVDVGSPRRHGCPKGRSKSKTSRMKPNLWLQQILLLEQLMSPIRELVMPQGALDPF